MYHSTDLLTVRGVAHLVVHGTSGSTSYEMIPHVQLEISGDVLSTADMVVQRRDGPRRLREIDDDDSQTLTLTLTLTLTITFAMIDWHSSRIVWLLAAWWPGGTTGVNPAGDAGDTSPQIFWLGGRQLEYPPNIITYFRI